MKYITYILFILFIPFCSNGQNHVLNGDFEYRTNCPGAGQVNYCIGWSRFVNTPDYFHTCATNPASIPHNIYGYQYPASGNAFMGFASTTYNNNIRETLTSHILPLTPGRRYEVSVSVNKPNNTNYAGDNIGVFFFDTIGNITSSSFLNIDPQIRFPNSVSDTTNWVRLVATYQADSAYDNIVIGPFFHDSLVNLDTLSTSGLNTSYYFIDSVVVKLFTDINIIDYDTLFCVGDTITIDYTAYGEFNSNNTFTLQLSDATGSFANATTLATKSSDTSGRMIGVLPNNLSSSPNYKIRIYSSSPVDTGYGYYNVKIGNLDSTNISFSVTSPKCTGETVTFSSTTTDTNIIYAWQGPNNFTSTSRTPTINNVTTAYTGSYITTSYLHGCIKRDTTSLTIKPLPAKSIITLSDTPVCQKDSLVLSAYSSTPGVTYEWFGPSGFHSDSRDTGIGNITTNRSGIYTSRVTLNGCSVDTSITITVKTRPANIIVSNNGPVCEGDSVQLHSNNFSTLYTYTWLGPNNYSSNNHISYLSSTTAANTGWYTLYAELNGCSFIDSTYVLVTAKPTQPTVTFSAPVCVGETLNLSASGSNNYSYEWYGPSGYTANTKNPTRSNTQLSHAGVYKVLATDNGCVSDTGQGTISINPSPFVVITSSPADSICVGALASFTALPGNAGSNPQYNWYVNTQLVGSGISYNTTNLNNQDVVYCEMTDNAKCSMPYTDQSNFLTMTVLPWLMPSVTITVSPTGPVQSGTYLTFTATATNAGNNPQYQWKRNGKDIVGATGSTWGALSLNNNDTITVEIISDYKCPQPTNAVSNKIVAQVEGVSINEIHGLTNLNLAPNPNRGQFVLSGQFNYNGNARISVVNMLGQTIYQTDSKIINHQLYQNIELPKVANGIYHLLLEAEGHKMNIKFSIE